MRSKITFDKGTKKTNSTKKSNISSISSTDLTKLKSLIKCNNQQEVLSAQSFKPKPSKCNGCGALSDKTDEKLYILGRNELCGKITTTTK